MAAHGSKNMEKIGFDIASSLNLEVFECSRLKKYAQGSSNPSASNRPGSSGSWVDWAEAVYPETGAWYITPFWFLLQSRRCTAEDLWECVRLIPESMQVPLIESDNSNIPAEMRLGVVPRSCLYELTEQLNPWTLGALACAMRRAELACDMGALRWAGVAMVWTVEKLIENAAPSLKERLSELRQLLGATLDSMIYPIGNGVVHPISADEIQRYGRERDVYERHFANHATPDWEPSTNPPWMEGTYASTTHACPVGTRTCNEPRTLG